MPDLLNELLSRDKSHEMQLAAATCLTTLHRAGALSADDPRILFRTLQNLVIIFFFNFMKLVISDFTQHQCHQ